MDKKYLKWVLDKYFDKLEDERMVFKMITYSFFIEYIIGEKLPGNIDHCPLIDRREVSISATSFF